jgi:hypothetical protein
VLPSVSITLLQHVRPKRTVLLKQLVCILIALVNKNACIHCGSTGDSALYSALLGHRLHAVSCDEQLWLFMRGCKLDLFMQLSVLAAAHELSDEAPEGLHQHLVQQINTLQLHISLEQATKMNEKQEREIRFQVTCVNSSHTERTRLHSHQSAKQTTYISIHLVNGVRRAARHYFECGHELSFFVADVHLPQTHT